MEKKESVLYHILKTPEFWEEVWRKAREESLLRRRRKSLKDNIKFWSQRAENFGKHVLGEKGRKRVEGVITWLEKQGVSLDKIRILDIGAGPGAFALAFAQRAEEVVALEPAQAMILLLERELLQKGIKNVKLVQKTWEEVDIDNEGWRGYFDLVFASNTPGINNWETLEKALNCGKKYCFIRSFAGKRENKAFAELWESLFGEKLPPWFGDIIYIFNLLYSRGFDLSFEVWDEKVVMENTMEEAVEILQEELHIHGIEEPSREVERIRQFVGERLVDGKFRQELLVRHGQILVRLPGI